MTNPVLLSGKFGHSLVLLSCHLELNILVLSDTSHFDLFAKRLEDSIVSCTDGGDEFGDLGISLLDRFGLFIVIWRKFL